MSKPEPGPRGIDDAGPWTPAQSGRTFYVVRTNTSGQIRYRLNSSDPNTTIFIATLGWWDYRGK
jgi:hypothetical protein